MRMVYKQVISHYKQKRVLRSQAKIRHRIVGQTLLKQSVLLGAMHMMIVIIVLVELVVKVALLT